jgi:hypothetical protein
MPVRTLFFCFLIFTVPQFEVLNLFEGKGIRKYNDEVTATSPSSASFEHELATVLRNCCVDVFDAFDVAVRPRSRAPRRKSG